MTEQTLQEAFLFRQPILSRNEELAAYQLSFRSGDAVASSIGKSSASLCAAYSELGLPSALGKARAYLGIDADFLCEDALELLPPERVVLELLLGGVPAPILLARCRRLRERGYLLAFSNYRGIDDRSRPLLPIVEVIKIDLEATSEKELADLAGSLRHLPIKLLAQGVATREQMERCRKLDFHLFQGRYFAQGEIVSGHRLSASQAALIRLCNLVISDVETVVIEDAFKHEPALTLNLLRVVNTVGHRGSRAGQAVTSLRHAIHLLGRRQLQRWLSLLLLAPASAGSDPMRSPLLQVAALRGRMMELLVESSQPRDRKLADLAFLTGILSMMPVALSLPIEEILAQIAVDSEVRHALCRREGLLGKVLALLESFDNDDPAGCDRLLVDLPVSLDRQTLNTCLGLALRWLNESDE